MSQPGRKAHVTRRSGEQLPFLEKIKRHQLEFTRSERAIASYLTAHTPDLPFETAASIAQKVGVSPMTVGRFLRSLGYEGLAALKKELGSIQQVPWLIGDRYERIAGRQGDGSASRLAQSLDLEIRALIGVYELARTARCTETAERIAAADRVYVLGCQTVRGVALDFVQRLEYVRPGVRFLDGLNGTYGELFAEEYDRSFLIIIDIHRYSRQAVLLAREAAARGVEMAIVTDAVCPWASDCTERIFPIATEVNLFWDSNGPLTSFLNLLVEAVIHQVGPSFGERIGRLETLQDRFAAFLD